MEEIHINQIINNLIGRFEYLGEDEFNIDNELDQQTHPITREPLPIEIRQRIEQVLLTRIQYRRSHDGAVLVPVSTVFDPRQHIEWYPDWLSENSDNNNSYYWRRLEEYLSRELTEKYGAENAGRVIRSIDDATRDIMDKLSNPLRRNFSYKGLVVGYVQSGKTANFTALIAKAVDAGYKFIVVLSGIHSILRRQTQIRLDKELTGMNDLGIDQSFISEPSDIKRWNRITTARVRSSRSRRGQIRVKDLGEFDTVNVDPFDSYCTRNTPTLAVIKKNVPVLNRLLEYVRQSEQESRDNMPLLIIDDEADQASIDGKASDPDSDPTGTNRSIRDLLGLFSRKSYVGYTATPFANVLIDMNSEHDTHGDDLYPRNFIISLPRPENYFGSSQIFNSDLSAFYIDQIPNEIDGLPYDEKAEIVNEGRITDNLARSVDQFLLACAIRNRRGDKHKPMSMLVHASHLKAEMNTVNRVVCGYFEAIQNRFQNDNANLKEEFREQYSDYISNCESIISEIADVDYSFEEFDGYWDEIQNVISVVQILVLNSDTDDRLDYTIDEEIKVIAIGGNQLSRGLTLEGLMVSYYLRDSRQYDTLLQMGRWFGYRSGYEDLTRIHTTGRIWDSFEHLALVEEELRSEIYRYEEEDLTPAEMAVAIRGHRNLNVTARNKMGAGATRQSSFSGSLNQTIWLPLDEPEVLQSNYSLGSSFIRDINNQIGFTRQNETGVYVSNGNVDGNTVLNEFLRRYSFVDSNNIDSAGMDHTGLIAYVERRLNHPSPELLNWTIGIPSLRTAINGVPEIDYGGLSINRIQRSRKITNRGFNVGVLTDPGHKEIDGSNRDNRSSQNAILLLYLIWSGSQARQSGQQNQRLNLFEGISTRPVDVLGFAIELPTSRLEPFNYLGQ